MEPLGWIKFACMIGCTTAWSEYQDSPATRPTNPALGRRSRSTHLDLTQQQTVPFERQGSLHPTQTTLEIVVDMDLAPFQVLCETVRRDLPFLNQTVSMKGVTTTTSVWHALEESCSDVRSWPTEYGLFRVNNQQQQRKKRNPVALGGLLGVGASMAAAWIFRPSVSPQIQQNAMYIKQHQRYLDELTKLTRFNMNWSYQAELRLTLQEARTTTRALTQGLSALVNVGRVTPALLTGADSRRIWPQVQEAVKRHPGEAELPVDSPVALYQFPADFSMNGGVLTLTIRIPLITETMTLYQRASFPLGREGLLDPVEIVRPEAHAYLAVDRRHSSYVVLAADQLDRCLQLGDNHFCPRLTVHKDFADICEAALFAGLNRPIQDLCKVEPFLEGWKIWPQHERQYHLYTRERMRGKLLCNDTQSQLEFAPGFHRVILEPTCALTTGKFYLPKETLVRVKTTTVTPLVAGVGGLAMVRQQHNWQQQLDQMQEQLSTMTTMRAATEPDDKEVRFPTWASVAVALVSTIVIAMTLVTSGVLTYFGVAIRRVSIDPPEAYEEHELSSTADFAQEVQ